MSPGVHSRGTKGAGLLGGAGLSDFSVPETNGTLGSGEGHFQGHEAPALRTLLGGQEVFAPLADGQAVTAGDPACSFLRWTE
jgi:hypothetical protein